MELAIVLMMLLGNIAVGKMKLNDPGLALPFKKVTYSHSLNVRFYDLSKKR
jgi:hypothetical protein